MTKKKTYLGLEMRHISSPQLTVINNLPYWGGCGVGMCHYPVISITLRLETCLEPFFFHTCLPSLPVLSSPLTKIYKQLLVNEQKNWKKKKNSPMAQEMLSVSWAFFWLVCHPLQSKRRQCHRLSTPLLLQLWHSGGHWWHWQLSIVVSLPSYLLLFL